MLSQIDLSLYHESEMKLLFRYGLISKQELNDEVDRREAARAALESERMARPGERNAG